MSQSPHDITNRVPDATPSGELTPLTTQQPQDPPSDRPNQTRSCPLPSVPTSSPPFTNPTSQSMFTPQPLFPTQIAPDNTPLSHSPQANPTTDFDGLLEQFPGLLCPPEMFLDQQNLPFLKTVISASQSNTNNLTSATSSPSATQRSPDNAILPIPTQNNSNHAQPHSLPLIPASGPHMQGSQTTIANTDPLLPIPSTTPIAPLNLRQSPTTGLFLPSDISQPSDFRTAPSGQPDDIDQTVSQVQQQLAFLRTHPYNQLLPGTVLPPLPHPYLPPRPLQPLYKLPDPLSEDYSLVSVPELPTAFVASRPRPSSDHYGQSPVYSLTSYNNDSNVTLNLDPNQPSNTTPSQPLQLSPSQPNTYIATFQTPQSPPNPQNGIFSFSNAQNAQSFNYMEYLTQLQAGTATTASALPNNAQLLQNSSTTHQIPNLTPNNTTTNTSSLSTLSQLSLSRVNSQLAAADPLRPSFNTSTPLTPSQLQILTSTLQTPPSQSPSQHHAVIPFDFGPNVLVNPINPALATFMAHSNNNNNNNNTNTPLSPSHSGFGADRTSMTLFNASYNHIANPIVAPPSVPITDPRHPFHGYYLYTKDPASFRQRALSSEAQEQSNHLHSQLNQLSFMMYQNSLQPNHKTSSYPQKTAYTLRDHRLLTKKAHQNDINHFKSNHKGALKNKRQRGSSHGSNDLSFDTDPDAEIVDLLQTEPLISSHKNAHRADLSEIITKLSSNYTTGLNFPIDDPELGFKGENVITLSRKSFFKKLAGYVLGGFNAMMWVALILSIISYKPLGGDNPAPLSLAIIVVLFLVIVCSTLFYAQVDKNASKMMESLNTLINYETVVIRNGIEVVINAKHVQVGDIVVFHAGQRIPADLRLFEISPDLQFDRSLISGETHPIPASLLCTDVDLVESRNIALTSSIVLRGHGKGIVFCIGDNTTVGTIIQDSTSKQQKVYSPIQNEIRKFTIIVSILAFSSLTISIILWATWQRTAYPGFTTASGALINSIGFLTAYVPQGLALSFSLNLAITAKQMFSRSVLVKNLATIETLGCVTVICSDKTGTITTGKMTVQQIVCGYSSMYDLSINQERVVRINPVLVDKNYQNIGKPWEGPHVGVGYNHTAVLAYNHKNNNINNINKVNSPPQSLLTHPISPPRLQPMIQPTSEVELTTSAFNVASVDSNPNQETYGPSPQPEVNDQLGPRAPVVDETDPNSWKNGFFGFLSNPLHGLRRAGDGEYQGIEERVGEIDTDVIQKNPNPILPFIHRIASLCNNATFVNQPNSAHITSKIASTVDATSRAVAGNGAEQSKLLKRPLSEQSVLSVNQSMQEIPVDNVQKRAVQGDSTDEAILRFVDVTKNLLFCGPTWVGAIDRDDGGEARRVEVRHNDQFQPLQDDVQVEVPPKDKDKDENKTQANLDSADDEDTEDYSKYYDKIYTLDFNSVNKFMATIVRKKNDPTALPMLFIKGAPDILMPHCATVMSTFHIEMELYNQRSSNANANANSNSNPNNSVPNALPKDLLPPDQVVIVDLDAQKRLEIIRLKDHISDQAMRVLGFAQIELPQLVVPNPLQRFHFVEKKRQEYAAEVEKHKQQCLNTDSDSVDVDLFPPFDENVQIPPEDIEYTIKYPDFGYEAFIQKTLAIAKCQFVGLLALSDPPKSNTKTTIETMKRAGIRTYMVTGDFVNTAVSVAKKVSIITAVEENIFGISDLARLQIQHAIPFGLSKEQMKPFVKPKTVSRKALVLNGPDLDTLNEQDWDYISWYFDEIVFARTTPNHKRQIVDELKLRGENIVAVTGDGNNDIPALQASDIGIVMGSGSIVAQDCASLVLLDNDFNSILWGILYGRLSFQNLRKIIIYLMSTGCFCQVVAIFANVVLGLPVALSSFQQVIFCAMNDVVTSISLMLEQPEGDLLIQGPRNVKKDRLISWKSVLHITLFYGVMTTIGAFGAYFMSMKQFGIGISELFLIYNGWQDGFHEYTTQELTDIQNHCSTAFYVTMVLCNIGMLLSVRTRRRYTHLPSNPLPTTTTATQSSPGHPETRSLTNKFTTMTNPIFGSRQNLSIPLCIILSIVIALLVVYVPGLNTIIETTPIQWWYWLIPILYAIGIVCIDELRKWTIQRWPESFVAKCAW